MKQVLFKYDSFKDYSKNFDNLSQNFPSVPTAIDCLNLLWGEDLFEHIKTQTNLYGKTYLKAYKEKKGKLGKMQMRYFGEEGFNVRYINVD